MHILKLTGAVIAVSLVSLPASAQVFEVIHPDVVEGGFEFEFLNTVLLDDVAVGDERSVHEIAVGYAPFHFWKTTVALEVPTVRGDGGTLEALEWENVFLAPIGGHGHDHDDDDHGGGFALGALGLYFAMEIPKEGGINAGGAAVGPIAELEIGPVETVANLFVEIPFEDGVDPGIAYAVSAAVPVTELAGIDLAAGIEAFGGVEEVFGNGTPLGQTSHVIGPALYFDIELADGKVIEPRFALLFGLTDGSPDAALSFNVEFKY